MSKEPLGCFPVFALVAIAMVVIYYIGLLIDVKLLNDYTIHFQQLAYIMVGRNPDGSFPTTVTEVPNDEDDPTQYYVETVVPKEDDMYDEYRRNHDI